MNARPKKPSARVRPLDPCFEGIIDPHLSDDDILDALWQARRAIADLERRGCRIIGIARIFLDADLNPRCCLAIEGNAAAQNLQGPLNSAVVVRRIDRPSPVQVALEFMGCLIRFEYVLALQ